ncbi:hypothetical protein H1C71_040443 [Ictidomys tridecemlineatus]|nr:hypothetical protein H1C71_040443 [Ictidomys tridecemlineatus]
MSQDQEDPKRAMPTERKSVWRSPEERRMSDLTRVLEWLERRRGKKKLDLQKSKTKVELPPKAAEKEKKKRKVAKQQAVKKNSVKNEEALYRRMYGSEQMGARLSVASTAYNKESSRKSGKGPRSVLLRSFLSEEPNSYRPWLQGILVNPTLVHPGNPPRVSVGITPYGKQGVTWTGGHLESRQFVSHFQSLTFTPPQELDIKDAIALESTQRPSMFRRQSSIGDPLLQEAIFSSRRGTLIRDWGSKAQDASFERKLKTLMDKSTEPKMESLKMLKPEEVLSCRYLRLSKNNIRTLLKLCRDAGLSMDIHPHMTESEIDSKKVFGRSSSATP